MKLLCHLLQLVQLLLVQPPALQKPFDLRFGVTMKIRLELLKLLLSHPGRVFSRDALMAEVWGTDFCGESRTVDMHIRTLRGKLGPYGDRIETVRGVGYRLEGKP